MKMFCRKGEVYGELTRRKDRLVRHTLRHRVLYEISNIILDEKEFFQYLYQFKCYSIFPKCIKCIHSGCEAGAQRQDTCPLFVYLFTSAFLNPCGFTSFQFVPCLSARATMLLYALERDRVKPTYIYSRTYTGCVNAT